MVRCQGTAERAAYVAYSLRRLGDNSMTASMIAWMTAARARAKTRAPDRRPPARFFELLNPPQS
jgi:hypothetical protein